MATGLFITATDTGAGKTFVTSRLVEALTAQGCKVAVRKPAESGCPEIDGRLVPQDAEALRRAAGGWEPLEAVCPYPLREPLSPPRAARRMKRKLFLDELAAACAMPEDANLLVVEGAGGLFAPLAEDALNADLARALNLPVLLVVPDRLGAINQALLGIHAITHYGLKLAGVILNQVEAERPRGMDNLGDLRQWTGAPLFTLPHGADLEAVQALLRLPLTS
ncbi:dethiobiotin synthase [Thiofaba sp. EF100]|uniref:dethiobiotin synthase n=1 Tax=Thiofaba sp. EF100 TaxID=3121274 RepID=UPI0032216A41